MQGFSKMFLFEVPNWNLKGEIKIAKCNLKEVWKSQFTTSKHEYYLTAIFKSLH